MTPKGRGSYFMALALSVAMWQCTATQVGTDTEPDMTPAVQTEEDILRLLEEEEMRQKQTLEEPEVPMDEADQALQERESRINELKAELLLKDDRISQLAKQLRERPDLRGGMTGYNEAQFNDRYRQAYLLFNSRRYQDALSIWSELISYGTRNNLSDNCQYWLGECHYALKNYRQAIIEFEKVFTFSKSNKKNYAQYKIAKCYLMLGDTGLAQTAFRNFIDQYPNSEARLITDAKKHLGM